MDFGSLENFMKDKFLNDNGPGELPFTNRKGEFVGGIVPKSDFALSCAAWLYKEIGDRKFCGTYVVFVEDENVKNIVVGNGFFRTHFGVVRVDEDLMKKVLGFEGVEQNDSLFKDKLDGFISFLQFVSKSYLSNIKILPIVMNSWNEDLTEFFFELNNIGFVAVTDLTRFSDTNESVVKSLDKRVSEIDHTIIEHVLNLDKDSFYDYVKNKKIYQKHAVVFLIELAKWKKRKPVLLQYVNSCRLDPSIGAAVGTASILL